MSSNTDRVTLIQAIKQSSLEDLSSSVQPMDLFQQWLDEAVASGQPEPNSMVLSTVDSKGNPSSRVVLLKKIGSEGIYFFTNYTSRKAHELSVNPRVAVNIHWPELERQIRIEGLTVKAEPEVSDDYYESRQRGSRIGAWASPQSKMIPDRAFLEHRVKEMEDRFTAETLKRPDFWGGYFIQPSRIEFWKGRENRLHDRIEFYLSAGIWKNRRLAP